ncbi:MAG: hypothetical protein ACOC2Z_18640, partial [Coleofasciculus sp.]
PFPTCALSRRAPFPDVRPCTHYHAAIVCYRLRASRIRKIMIKSGTGDSLDYDPTKENVHAATDPDKCRDMERRNGWRLKKIKPTRDPTLKVDCVFYGEQTTFEDERYD